jgi:spore coat polysaccharide biosynthesis protein SpsF
LSSSEDFVFVAVRLKSSRLPRKALIDVEGKPLLLRLVERIEERFSRQQVVLCTSVHPQDDGIQEFAEEHGITCYRGDEMDVMHRFIGAADLVGARTIARVTGDNPLTDPDSLAYMFRTHHEAGAEYSYTDDLPVGTRAEIIDVESLRRIHAQLVDPSFSEYMTYMLKRPDKLKTLEIPAPDSDLKRPELSVTVDTDADIRLVRRIYAEFGGAVPALGKIIAWLDANPEWKIIAGPPPSAPPEGLVCGFQGDLNFR